MIVRNLSQQILRLEDAQTEIKRTIKRYYFSGKKKADIIKAVDGIIVGAVAGITSKTLKIDTKRALGIYSNRIYNGLLVSFGFNGKVAFQAIKKANLGKLGDWETQAKGIPNQEYSKTYMTQVKKVMNEIADFRAIDPNDVRGRNSLRNLAEMQERYEGHLKQIEDLKEREVKLVVSSVHADCSDRCFPFQGKVYSLDGSSGTIDGRRYEPLEKATDIYYTTKAGRVYKNGLLGFNCRHYLYEYQPKMSIPYVKKDKQQLESKINSTQRTLESKVRTYRERALMLKDLDKDGYAKARKQAIEANKEYQAFSEDHNRAFYPDRAKILD